MENNHKALAYRDSDKLLGFTYSTENWKNELGVFQIEGDTIIRYQAIDSPNTNQGYNSFERGLIFDDLSGQTYIAYFANGQIVRKLLDDLR